MGTSPCVLPRHKTQFVMPHQPLYIVPFLLALCFVSPCFAQQQQTNLTEADKLFTADVLRITLFARTIDEWKFCEYVIQKRDDGTIPSQIIYLLHRKALNYDRHRRFAYFKMALETLCQREGIALYPTSTKTSTTAPQFPTRLQNFNGRY